MPKAYQTAVGFRFGYDLFSDYRDYNILPEKELHRSLQLGVCGSLAVGRSLVHRFLPRASNAKFLVRRYVVAPKQKAGRIQKGADQIYH